MTQDFGTSRWPLSNKITLVPLRAEGARCVFAAEAKPPNTSPDVRSRGKRGTVVLILTFHLLTPKMG